MVTLADDEKVICPNPGPQTDAFASRADIVIYGGGAGGGKTWFLVAEGTRNHDVPEFRGAIFRRTYPQITGPGGIWDEARKLYPMFGGKMREGTELDVKFPSGASITFLHMQHEKTKYEYQGHQIAYLGFDELTHFSESQFFYMLSRNRSTCGLRPYVRATCNPDGGSWVAEFIEWWIDPESGLAIKERCGQLRYFVRADLGQGEQIFWADTPAELIEQFPDFTEEEILSVTFIEAAVEDNPHLDKAYIAKLKALPRIERERLLGRNWKTREGSIIDSEWFKHYTINSDRFVFGMGGHVFEVPVAQTRRFATIDTAGTSKEKAATLRGDPPSWSVCAIWDWLPRYQAPIVGGHVTLHNLLFLRYVWRGQVDWPNHKTYIREVLDSWNVPRVHIENAHYGQPLSKELPGIAVEMVGPVIPGMDDSSRGAKLERAVASGLLAMLENGKLFVPNESSGWLSTYLRELTVWTGLPKETADQIDVTSYAAYVARNNTSSWGGVLPHSIKRG